MLHTDRKGFASKAHPWPHGCRHRWAPQISHEINCSLRQWCLSHGLSRTPAAGSIARARAHPYGSQAEPSDFEPELHVPQLSAFSDTARLRWERASRQLEFQIGSHPNVMLRRMTAWSYPVTSSADVEYLK